MSYTRLHFIDVLRGIALLMMLQGHFTDSLLSPEYRGSESMIYTVWKYLRGMTAPLFFTISGLVYSYLIYQKDDEEHAKARIFKGFKRGLQLILIGYLLRAPVFHWMVGVYDTYFLVIDVLQVIGVGLLVSSLLFYVYLVLSARLVFPFLSSAKRIILCVLLLVISFCFIVGEPYFRTLNLDGWPLVISNYLSKDNGSLFTLVPWLGYMFAGSAMGLLLSIIQHSSKRKLFFAITVIGVGLILCTWSHELLMGLGRYSGWDFLAEVAGYNAVFPRLGVVVTSIGTGLLCNRYLKLPLLQKVGKHTLAIYVVHFILLYGSFTGWGLVQIFDASFSPLAIVLGLIIFIPTCCALGMLDYSSALYSFKTRLRSMQYRLNNRTYN